MNPKNRGWHASTTPRPAVSEEGDIHFDDASDIATANAGRMSLGELTEAAQVSVRTVRYYIAEGLLPPPEGAGPASAYNQGHLDRLRLIQRFKEDYLPLKEIRRRLAGLGDDEVKALLEVEDDRRSSLSDSATELPPDDSLAGARNYLALMEARERYRTEPLSLQFAPSPGPLAAAQFDSSSIRFQASEDVGDDDDLILPEREAAIRCQSSELWHRIALGDEAELVISERVYNRHRDRIDWLVRWARKVFG